MSSLREEVLIKTTTGELHGYLFVGQDGLPQVHVDMPIENLVRYYVYLPATFPSCYELQQAELGDVGILFESWRTILEMQFDLAQAQRYADDDAKERVRNRETENRVEEE